MQHKDASIAYSIPVTSNIYIGFTDVNNAIDALSAIYGFDSVKAGL